MNLKSFSIGGSVVLLFLSIPAVFLQAGQQDTFKPEFPLGVDSDVFSVPADNPMTPQKVELGKLLYFDPRVSVDGTISCASCHDPSRGFTDQQQFSEGVGGQLGNRNAPSVINSAFNLFQFWDGRAPSLEEQAKGPIGNPVEMAHTLEDCAKKIAAVKGYKAYFKAAFGSEEVTGDKIAQAIATFERTVLSGNSAWDRYVYGGDKTALNESARRGLALFEGKANCTRCHVGFNLTDNVFHNLGVGMDKADPDLGRFKVTAKEGDQGAFKTPMLRDIQKTFPYMHNGSEKTLQEVIEFYDRGGNPNQWLDPKMVPLHLTAEEKADLLAFLGSLEGDWKPMEPPKLPE